MIAPSLFFKLNTYKGVKMKKKEKEGKNKEIVKIIENWDECKDALIGLGLLNEYGE